LYGGTASVSGSDDMLAEAAREALLFTLLMRCLKRRVTPVKFSRRKGMNDAPAAADDAPLAALDATTAAVHVPGARRLSRTSMRRT